MKDESWYLCGDVIPLPGLFVRRALNCRSEIETVYYGQTHTYLPPICIYCGNGTLLDDFNPYIVSLKQHFSVIRPLCESCHANGKEAKTWGKLFFKKPKTK